MMSRLLCGAIILATWSISPEMTRADFKPEKKYPSISVGITDRAGNDLLHSFEVKAVDRPVAVIEEK